MVTVTEDPVLPITGAETNGHGPRALKWVSCIIRSEKLDAVTEALNKLNLVGGMTVTDLRGTGREEPDTGMYHGTKFSLGFVPKAKVELAIEGTDLEEVEKIISTLARTGEVGDGKIFIMTLKDLMRIRTGEKGASAL